MTKIKRNICSGKKKIDQFGTSLHPHSLKNNDKISNGNYFQFHRHQMHFRNAFDDLCQMLLTFSFSASFFQMDNARWQFFHNLNQIDKCHSERQVEQALGIGMWAIGVCWPIILIFICMTSLAFASQGDCEPHGLDARNLKRRVASLQSEVEILSKIVRVNEATLEEIGQLILQQMDSAKMITTHEIMNQHNRLQIRDPKTAAIQQQIHHEIAEQIGRMVSTYHQDFLKVYEGIISQHSISTGRLKKQLRENTHRGKAASERGDCDTSIEEHSPSKAIFEIPIQVQLMKEVADSDVQVNIASSKSFIYQVPIEMHEIFEVPIQMNQIFQVTIQLNTRQLVEKHRVFEVPLEMEEVYQVPVELDLLDDDYEFKNIIYEAPVFTYSTYEQENINLRLEIVKLSEQLNQIKDNLQTATRHIYEIPIELQHLGEADLNSSRCQVYMPEIDSQKNLQRPQMSFKYDSIKHAQSKISTQICTRPDLELSPLPERDSEQKSSIILSSPVPIQQNINYASVSHKANTLKNINFYISQSQISQVESALEESNQITQNMRDIPVEIEIDGQTIEIEMEVVQQIKKFDQQIQTDYQEPKKTRIVKIPTIKVVEIPYEVERIVTRTFRVPILKVVEVPVQIAVPQIMEVPIEMNLITEKPQEQEGNIVSLKSANNIEKSEIIEKNIERIVEVPKLVLVEVPIQVVVEKVIVKEVPIEVVIEKEVIVERVVTVQKEVIIEKLVQVPPRVIIKEELPIELVLQKETIVQRFIQVPRIILKQVPMEVIVEREVFIQKIVELPSKTIIKQVPIEVIVEKQVILQKIVEMPSRTIIKEVPIEVIVEKQVIVEKDVIVEKIVELPQKTIIKQVPIEVIIEKIVELPAKTIIKQVPIEVIVQKIVQLPPRTIIKQVPVQVIVQRQVERVVEKVVQRIVHVFHEVPVEIIVERIVEVKTIEIRQVPVEVIVEKQVVVERPVIVEKEVYITKIRQVPIEVIVEKIVQVPTIVQIPVEVIVEKKVPIVKEIPYEVVIIEEVEKIVEVQVTVIRQVPVEVMVEVEKIKQVIKIIKEVVEIPVLIYMEEKKNQIFDNELAISSLQQESEQKIYKKLFHAQVPKPQEASHQLLLQSNYPIENNADQLPTIIEMPVEVIIEKEVPTLIEVPVEVIRTEQKIVEIPTQVIVIEQKQKIIYIPREKIVEVPIQVIIEKPIYIQKIVQVPIEVVIEKEVIIEKQVIVKQIVQVPIEVVVYKDRLIEVPIEVIIEKEVIVQVEKIREVPVEVLIYKGEQNFIDAAIEVDNMRESEQKASIVLQSRPENQKNKDFAASQVVKMTSKSIANQDEQANYEITYEFPAEVQQAGGQFILNIDAANFIFGQHEQMEIQIPYQDYRPEQADNEAQTDSIISLDLQHESKPQSAIEKLNKQNSNADNQIQFGTQTIKEVEKVKIIEMPIEVENIDYEQVQKEAEYKYRQYLADLKERYGAEISQLSKTVINLQSIIVQSNAQKEFLKENIERNALKEQSLLKELQFMTKQKEDKSEQLSKQIEELQFNINIKAQEIEQFNVRITNLQQNMNKIHQVPVEIDVTQDVKVQVKNIHETSDQQIQTDDICLTLPDLLEIPIELQIKQAFDEAQVQEIFEQEQIQEVQLLKQERINVSDNTQMDDGCQTQKKIENAIFEVPIEINVLKATAQYDVQTDFTVLENEDIILLRETMRNPYEIIQIPTELIQPVVYEIPTEVNMDRDAKTVETQTQPLDEQYETKKIYELPVEFSPLYQTNQVEIQTQQDLMSNTSEQSSSSGEQKKQQFDAEQEQEFLVQTQKTIHHRKQMSQDNFFKKKKPYSEYFTSRIFEIPVEVNLNKEQPKNIKTLLQTEVQTEASQLNPLLDAGLSSVAISRQRELIASHLRIVSAFEPLKFIGEASITPLKRSPDRKIFRFGSENDTLGVNANFSNVQSMTPNQLDGSSSYDKFPMPTININNISLIKKSSIHSEGKFFGSLDMREELLNHDEAIESMRMANRKLTGFQQGESSSEEGDIHNLSREMIIEENETIVSRDINRIQTPNLQPHDLNFSEYATMKEKMYYQQQKINYQELFENAQTELEGLRQKLYYKGEEVAELKAEIDKESCKYEEEIRKINEELIAAGKITFEQETNLEVLRTKITEMQENKLKLERKIQMLFQNWEKLKEENEKGEISSNKEYERLRGIISQKIAQIKELKADEHHQKDIYEGQLHQYRDIINKKSEIIEDLEEELQRRNDRIDQLVDSLQEMRKNINNHNNEVDTAAIYEQEFVRVKQAFEDEKRELHFQLQELQNQNKQLRAIIAEEEKKNQDLEGNIIQLERQVMQAKQDYSSLHHLKSELENNFMEGVKCLNQELQEMKGLVREKDQIIQHIHPTLNESPIQHQDYSISEQTLSRFRIEYISKQASLVSPDNTKQLEAYSRKLENLLKKYERIIIQNQGTIEELQDKVYEYLKDALQKEQEAEGLYMKLVDYQNTINNILVQKVTLDIENKRLSKQIQLSEKKLNVLGNRLIQVARNRADYESDDDYYYD